jgi:tripartite-type tricarboxylate transporter receptor subunit TctC
MAAARGRQRWRCRDLLAHFVLAAAVSILTPAAAGAAAPRLLLDGRSDPYPSRLIRIVVPFPPGASTDTIARLILDPIEARLDVRLTAENRSGAGGNIAADSVLRAAPDGHTWLLGTAGLMSINVLLYPSMKFDPALAFAPITLLGRVPYVLVTNSNLPPRSVAALIEFASRRPWILNYGSAGSGSTLHLAAELFKSMTDTRIVHIAYRGGAPAIRELVGGHIQMMFSSVPLALPYVESGHLRALAVSSATRSLYLPATPTMQEAGLPDFEFTGWFGLFVSAQTPARIIPWLNQELTQALSGSEIRAKLEAIGVEPATSSPRYVHELIRRDSLRWQRVIRSNNIKPDWEDFPQ